MNMKKLVLVLLAGAILQAAFAQDTATDEESASDSLDFIVTAGRTQEEVQKVSGQVTVITAEDIAGSGASTVVDLLKTVPGLRFVRDRNGNGIDISMRGIGSEYGKGKVLILVDGVRVNPVQTRGVLSWDTINLSGIERIEVLDGGASVQYGDNASVGVINIITKKSGEAKTDITVSGGSFFQNEQRFSHYRPTDWGGFTVSGGHRGTQGYQKHTANDTGNGELRGIWDINDAMSLQANVGFAFGNNLLANPLTQAQYDDDPTQNGPGANPMNPAVSNSSTSTADIKAGLGYTWAINDMLSLDLPVSYNWNRSRAYFPSYGIVYESIPQMFGARPKITAELKPAGMGLRIVGGVDMLAAFSETKISYDIVAETNPTVHDVTEFTIGPYALINFEPLSFLSLNAGVRYDAAFVNAHMDSWSGTVMSFPMSYPAGTESTDWNAFVYEAGITVNPLDFLKVYAKYSTQFRYPYLDELIELPSAPGGTLSLKTDLEPEKGWTVEGGVGLNFKGIAKLDANLYYLKIDNEIAARLTGPASYVIENLDPIDRLGTNIGLSLTPVKYVEFDFDYGFVNAVFSEGLYKDKYVPLVPKHTFSGSLMLHAPFGFSIGPNAIYKSEFYPGLDNDNTADPVESSLIWGLQARYVTKKLFSGDLSLILSIQNIADTKYATLVYLPATYYIDSSMGRSVNISVNYRF
jgi:iron complex outermembrane receptor protein